MSHNIKVAAASCTVVLATFYLKDHFLSCATLCLSQLECGKGLMLLRHVVKGSSLRDYRSLRAAQECCMDLSAAQSVGPGLHKASESCRKSLRKLAVPGGKRTKAALKFFSTSLGVCV